MLLFMRLYDMFIIYVSCFGQVPILPNQILRVKYRLNDVHGDLLSISEYKGFRRFVKATADEIGV
jgi:hypothetical protein